MKFSNTTLLAILAILSAQAVAAPIPTASPTTTTTIVPSTIISSSITAAPSVTKRLENKDSFATYIRHQGGRGGWDLMPPMAKREVEEEMQVCERISEENGECINVVEEEAEEEEERNLGDCTPGMSWGC
ncbi:hypothetical protein BCR34DRAFT_555823 [Clohesyomyces aquaticus]|uniref:Uncharacterized protein n=1 Tax=Clohesyomyces aquaticus TaxID=1231657 RepID=A0A1Y2A461_9PLEO|nr:hypothetical protein BCR34DRAFT_555823 [Clohesyomyces aquaticus]